MGSCARWHCACDISKPHWERTITVPVFTPEESMQLLVGLVGEGAALDCAADVAEMLGHHPLALMQAGGWVRETNMGLAKYAELLKSRPERRELLLSAPDSLMQQDYKSTIAATVEFATQVLKSEAAADLFDLCSIASPDHIPYDLLRSFHARQGSGAVTESGFSAILKELCDHSLITAADDGDTACCFDIHRLVQTVRQDWMQAYRDSSMRVVSAAVETAADLFNFDLLRNVESACGSRAAYYASLAPHCI